MKTIPDFAREILGRSKTPALPFPRLVEAITEERGGHVATLDRILAELPVPARPISRSRPRHRPVASFDGYNGGDAAVESRHVGPRSRSRYGSDFPREGPDSGVPSVSRKARR
jgi:hypothetical protein